MQTISYTITKCRWLFVLVYLLVAINVQSQTNITKVEYFFDTDPGFGLANNIPVSAATDISDQLYNIDITDISNGFHKFFIRSQDANGVWSITNSISVFRTNSGGSNNPKIAKAEYFFDTDHGFGLGSSIPLSAANNISDIILNIDLSGISAGFHSFYIRTQDANGVWSLTNTISFDHVVPKAGSGYCLQFTGSGKKVTATQQTTIKNNFTIDAWINASATTQIQTQANSGVSGTSGNDKYVVMPVQGTANFGANTAGVGFAVGSNGVCVFEHDASYLPSLLSWSGTLTG